ncbi:hypothetical protein SAMN02927921_01347 [Sinomicrobium oceani]|uniref:Uncharacterized protein n=1 Tax=Sinomicrobium oceani TaxID=1150368 RepID=A0A1K1NN06_9FLAO|nr:hypothetical protein SAMN02927921_01347 [Sinomicrobium oceani]
MENYYLRARYRLIIIHYKLILLLFLSEFEIRIYSVKISGILKN